MCVLCVAAASLPLLLGNPLANGMHQETKTFTTPIDGVSAHIEPRDATTEVRYKKEDGTWSTWESLVLDDEQDPKSSETNMVMFPTQETSIEVRTNAKVLDVHPLRVSTTPVSSIVAARAGYTNTSGYRIVTREEWGANPDILVTNKPPSSSTSSVSTDEISDNGPATPSTRERECNDHVRLYPDEFTVVNTVKTDAQGRTLRWPQQQMGSVKMLVVHHTAMNVDGDTRPSVERMRALYEYHANNRGWGDVGYHYIVDEAGVIYEGRAGGPHVVAGHAYCNNVGTIGIALMGNFEESAPPQAQVKALQWLLKHLADQEHLDVHRSVMFHGESHEIIQGHRDVLSTTCPGFYLYGVLDQVREHVRTGNIDESVNFPVKPKPITAPYVDRTAERRAKREAATGTTSGTKVGLSTIGATTLKGRPGEQVLVSLRYQAGTKIVTEGTALAQIARSSDDIGVWIDKNGTFQRLRETLNAPVRIGANEAVTLRLRLQFPMDAGATAVSIGGISYRLEAEGRRVRNPDQGSVQQTYTRDDRPSSSSVASSSVSSRSSTSVSSRPTTTVSVPTTLIRIRLTLDRTKKTNPNNATLRLPEGTMMGSTPLSGTVWLREGDNTCTLETAGGLVVSQGILRLDAKNGEVKYTDAIGERRFTGVLECRMVDGVFAIINELPLESYMEGVSEEPDSEPVEKQKAFAVAARSYAAFYMNPNNRKFPGKPYDGSDDAATFQKFSGVPVNDDFDAWIDAVRGTKGMVLTKNGDVLKIPYFTSDDGRTRSPREVGWNTFPYAEVFTSKDDPWCKDEPMRGHGVGMSGCGARGQANEGKTWTQILNYYFPGTTLTTLR